MSSSVVKKNVTIPLYFSTISAGFPSSAEDYVDMRIDLNERLIKHPAATFFVRVKGSSMQGCGISQGDILVVDRSLEPQNKSIVVALLDGEFTVKKVKKSGKQLFLLPENSKFHPIEITEDMEFEVWGVVIYSIRGY
ncbi:LexA family protein [Patescibacteria group bacterium]